MKKSEYKPRIIDSNIQDYLSAFGAVCVEGPKWCGKTWTSLYHSNSEFMIVNPANNFQNKKLAEISPALVLEGETPRLIDEWQEVPMLWDAVRYIVDERAEKGQFILTGSSTPNRKGVQHSGAGRIGRLRMRPMSLYESGNSSGQVSLKDLIDGNIKPTLTGEVDIKRIAEFIYRGGWPGNQNVPIEKAGLLPSEYLKAIVEDDSYRVDGVKRNSYKMKLLLRSLARNESTTVTNQTLRKDIKASDEDDINSETITEYLNVLNRLFLFDNLEPFAPEKRSSIRIKQAEKRHFSDPSIACSLLGLNPNGLINDLKTMGFLFEALCERDLKIYAESFGGKLFHYQDYNNNEIDAVLELPNNEWCAFEIKLGAGDIDIGSANLIKISNAIKKAGGNPPKTMCVICGMSNAIYKRPDGVIVIPITALKN